MMRKKILIFLGLVLLGLALLYVFRYEMGNCLCKQLPSNTVAAINVDIRKMEQNALHKFLASPWKHLRSTQRSVNDTTKAKASTQPKSSNLIEATDMVQLPKNLIFFAQDASMKTWISNKIKIKPDTLASFARQNGIEPHVQSNGLVYSISNAKLAVTGRDVRICFTDKPLDKLVQLINNTSEYLSCDDTKIRYLTKSDHVVTGVGPDDLFIEADIIENGIHIQGKMPRGYLRSTQVFSDVDQVGTLSAFFDKQKVKSWIDSKTKTKWNNYTKLNPDSLYHYWDGQLNVALQDMDVVSDTIKTYEYDDDFNKIETSKIHQTTSLSLHAQMGTLANIDSYLLEQKAVVMDKGDSILSIFPLARTRVRSSDSALKLSTSSADPLLKKSDLKLRATIDFDKYDRQALNSMYDQSHRMGHLKRLEITVASDDRFDIRLTMNKNLQSPLDLLSAWHRVIRKE